MPRTSWKAAEVLYYTQAAATTLRDIASSTDVPFLSAIAALSTSVIPLVQGVKTNKDRCVRMLEEVHQLLCSLATVVLDSEHPPTPKILDQIGGLSQTLQKFHACLRSQKEISKIKRLFKQVELTAQLDACEAELHTAVEVFKIISGVGLSGEVAKLYTDGEQRHQELLELVKTRKNLEFSDAASSIQGTFRDMNSSSGSLPMLPALPHIFHGRERDLQALVAALLSEPARVSILGMGGIGKTALATAALYHPSVTEKYLHRHFVSCESASNAAGLITLVGSHLGIEPSATLTKTIIRFFSECGTAILLLDNLETPWEPFATRSPVEEFLSLLSDIPHLALLITMRGVERPAKVKWTRPFLPPLDPLSFPAARQTFVEIADDPAHEDEEALAEILELTGHLPLALTLMASIASLEGYRGAIARWRTESTSLLSDGHGRTSNLDVSIRVSLSSPRMNSSPHAMDLLSLIALLPDGIAEHDLLTSQVPIPDIQKCRSALIRTALIYMDHDGRIKSLSPIRGYMQRFHWPSHSLTDPLRRYFQELMSIWFMHQQCFSGVLKLVPRLTSHLGNIRELVLAGLSRDESGSEIGYNILTLNNFCHIMLKGQISLMQQVPGIAEATNDTRLHWKYIEDCLQGLGPPLATSDAAEFIRDGIQYFVAQKDLAGQGIDIVQRGRTYH
ncbi:P-loop containing nucleoside triphosphate hydrolase protein [Mycena vulgaris]|nr:P-loop containing nucleoside triphosphate hydrolase protein [Mycena vulgaris]